MCTDWSEEMEKLEEEYNFVDELRVSLSSKNILNFLQQLGINCEKIIYNFCYNIMFISLAKADDIREFEIE